MSILFPEKEKMHRVNVKFTPAYLPEAKRPYNLKTANQTELDIRQIAIKAKAYHITADIDAIIDGFTAMMEAICYLAADGFILKTNYFTLGLRIPGEYDGTETSLPQDVSPLIRLQASRRLKQYIKERVTIAFDGKIDQSGFIASAVDDATGASNERVTIGGLITIRGVGLKIMAEPDKQDKAGIFFEPQDGGEPVKCKIIAVNERKTLKVLVPPTLEEGKSYRIAVDTWSAASRNGSMVKTMRSMRSKFTLLAYKFTD